MIAVTFPNEPLEDAIRQRWRDTRYRYITIAWHVHGTLQTRGNILN